MSKKISLYLDDAAYEVIEAEGGDNKSAFVSELLLAHKRRRFEVELRQHYIEAAQDPEIGAALTEWTNANLDGETGWKDDWDDTKAPRNLVG